MVAENMELEALRFDVDGSVGTITMNQPKRRNALSPAMTGGLKEVLRSIQFDSGLRALILTGTEGVFCAGGDLQNLNADAERNTAEDRMRFYRHHEWFQIFANLEFPVIAAIDGAAYGAGFSLALGADFILCSERARLCCVFPRIGLVPDIGAFHTLPRIVGLQKAKEIMFTGRPIDAEEAQSLGIAMSVHPADELAGAARSLAERLCKASTPALGATKRILNQSFDVDARALIEMEAGAQTMALSSAYHRDAIQRFLDKRPLEYDWERMDREDGEAAE